jgi:adenylate cyclase
MDTSGRERTERRLAAILAADIAGYSRLIGADEEGTLSRIRLIRADIIDPAIAAHRGRLVKTTGDGLLVEFVSVVDALRCAVDIQQQIADRSAGVPPAERIEFRIGIHQGDVVVEDGDIRRWGKRRRPARRIGQSWRDLRFVQRDIAWALGSRRG